MDASIDRTLASSTHDCHSFLFHPTRATGVRSLQPRPREPKFQIPIVNPRVVDRATARGDADVET